MNFTYWSLFVLGLAVGAITPELPVDNRMLGFMLTVGLLTASVSVPVRRQKKKHKQ